ncbi:MAG: hypothetical protein ACJAZX_001059 [Rickettsiales bacterium]|jgi:hypothetical protein
MGRYYTGDIDGKFWFGVQSSSAPSRFGGREIEPNFIIYNFDSDDLETIEEQLKSIKEKLGGKLDILIKFFDENNGYCDEQMEELKISNNDLSEFADYKLGMQIFDYLQENDSCQFEAEL